MKEKLIFIEFLFKDLLENMKIHVEKREIHEKAWKNYMKDRSNGYPSDGNYMNKDHGKVALKRKITYLRQMLLNLERMLDE